MGCFVHDAVVGLAASFERQVVAGKLDIHPGDLCLEDAKRLLEELLPGLVSFENDDRRFRHGCDSTRRHPVEMRIAVLRTRFHYDYRVQR